MEKTIVGFIILYFTIAFSSQAQLSPYYEYQHLYDDASELFDKRKYGAAQKKIDTYIQAEKRIRNQNFNDQHVHARYIQAVSAYYLDRADAVALMEDFVFRFGENSKAVQIRYYLGKYYFDRRTYNKAIKPLIVAYQQGSMGQERFDEVVFMLGYSHFMDNNSIQATRYFDIASKRPNAYQEDALYYRSVILYQEGEYEAAYIAFQELKDSKKYGREIRLYLANTLLKLKRYDELYVLADELIRGPKVKSNEAQIYYIVANASFERDDYPRTTEYFRRYTTSRGKMNRSDHFRYGYSHYKQDEYAEAIPILEKALGANDSLGQVASYYLGFCFLKAENDESSAKFAFQKAAQGGRDSNPLITEEALFQWAQVSFATESYDEALDALTRLGDEFPRTRYRNEAQTMIGEVFLYQRNYPRSIRYFESISLSTDRSKKAYQTVCYFYGLQLYEKPDYKSAEIYFQKAIDATLGNAASRDMALSARYWQAEAIFRRGDFSGAATAFNRYLSQPSVLRNEFYSRGFYGLGWANFKQKKYDNALKGFSDFIAKGGMRESRDQVVDAHLRAGDCLFLQRNYKAADTYYQKVLDFRYTYRDYALYQLAESQYRQGNYRGSVTRFDQLIRNYPDSDIRVNSLDRISEIYSTWIKDNNQAIKYAKILVRDYPRSPIAADAYNRLALASYYTGDQQNAVLYFKKVLQDYGGDKRNAQIALDNLGSLVSEAEFDRILRDYRSQNPNMNNNLAELVFNTGKERFFAMNYSSAIEQFTTYIRDYKNGPNYYEALIFRARSYRETGQPSRALADYRAVYSRPTKNEFTHIGYQEAAEIKFEQKDYQSSLELYKMMDEVAGKLQNQVQAKFGIAKNYIELGDYELAQNALQVVADNNEVAVYSRTKASVQIGNCQYLRGRLNEALQTYKEVEESFKNAFGAESQHMISQILYDQGKNLQARGLEEEASVKFEAVKTATTYQKNNYPSFNYWKARTFLVAAEAYYELGDVFQAKGTLESLVTEDRFPDVQEAARQRLAQIESLEAENEFSPEGIIDDNNNLEDPNDPNDPNGNGGN